MTIWAAPGQSFEAVAQNAPTGLTGTMRVRIINGQGGTTLSPRTTGIVESPAGSGVYTATLTAPTVAGQYSVVFDTGTLTPNTSAAEDLTVTSSTPGGSLPNDADLTTLAAVRSYLGKDASDTDQDDEIQQQITAVSAHVNSNIAQFRPLEDDTTKTFLWSGGPLSLHPFFLRSASAVTYGSTNGTGGTALTTTDYGLPNLKDGAYRWLRFPNYGVPYTDVEVLVTGDWGVGEIPADVERAVIIAVAIGLTEEVSGFAPTAMLDPDGAEQAARPLAVAGSLPWGARNLLRRFKLPSI